jgi:hypothetical protein
VLHSSSIGGLLTGPDCASARTFRASAGRISYKTAAGRTRQRPTAPRGSRTTGLATILADTPRKARHEMGDQRAARCHPHPGTAWLTDRRTIVTVRLPTPHHHYASAALRRLKGPPYATCPAHSAHGMHPFSPTGLPRDPTQAAARAGSVGSERDSRADLHRWSRPARVSAVADVRPCWFEPRNLTPASSRGF